MGKLSRTKGAAFERLVARRLDALCLEEATFARVTSESQEGNIGDVRDREQVWPFVVQCKHRKVVNVKEAVREAEAAAALKPVSDGDFCGLPIAWVRWNGGEELVAMRPEHFIQLVLAVDEMVTLTGMNPKVYPWYTIEGPNV